MDYQNTYETINLDQATIARLQNAFINKVFCWMSAGLVLTGVLAYFVATRFGEVIAQHPNMFTFLLLAEFGLVMYLSFAMRKISAAGATLGFIVYAALNGVTLSVIFLAYAQSVIASAFFAAAGAFGGAGLFGYLYRGNLSTMGRICSMGVFGLVIAMILEMIWPNDQANFVISCIGVVIFLGLTAWDLQKIRLLAVASGTGVITQEESKKSAIYGALMLYLDFINLFLFLLRIFGGGNRK